MYIHMSCTCTLLNTIQRVKNVIYRVFYIWENTMQIVNIFAAPVSVSPHTVVCVQCTLPGERLEGGGEGERGSG